MESMFQVGWRGNKDEKVTASFVLNEVSQKASVNTYAYNHMDRTYSCGHT